MEPYAVTLIAALHLLAPGEAPQGPPPAAREMAERAEPLERIEVAPGGRGFRLVPSGRPFAPCGFNYDHDERGRLLEEYWEDEWERVVSDFHEMKELGANVVRIHLQFGKLLPEPDREDPRSLERLSRLVRLAEETGLYLDLTGLACYLKELVPPWYDELTEEERWAEQARFWEAVARTCAPSPAVFCYDLMNEPVVPGGDEKREDWLGPPFAEKYHYVQFVTLERKGRERADVARDWIRTLVRAIRKVDRGRLITVGLVDWSLDRPGLTSGFVPARIGPELDFLSVHIYPKRDKVDEAIETLRGFAVGKPVIVEETFHLNCGIEDLRSFLERARGLSAGTIGFYWGKTPEECRRSSEIADALLLQWLELFREWCAITN